MLGPINAGVDPPRPPCTSSYLRAWIRRCTCNRPTVHRVAALPRLSPAAFNCQLNVLGRRTSLAISPRSWSQPRENENFIGIVSISQKVTPTGGINRDATGRWQSNLVTAKVFPPRKDIIGIHQRIYIAN